MKSKILSIFLHLLHLFAFPTLSLADSEAFSGPHSNVENNAAIEAVGHSRPWLNLLYYENKGGKFLSLVDKAIFFRSPNGRTDPVAELKTMVHLFSQPQEASDNHPQCLFPSRYKFLTKFFILQPPIRCPKLEEWKINYKPTEITLVYASQYLSNPASVFGHSFLLFPSSAQTRSLWLTMNYAATIPKETSGLAYVFGGITGWFGGQYSVMPFYQRIFQYGSIENRDLWLYKITMSESERSFFTDHLWELVHAADFKYYFMDENCAGILLRTFAATLEDMQESYKLPIYVHPMEVIHRLQKVGRISSADMIPSQGNILRANLNSLDTQQIQHFRQALENPEQPIQNADAATAETLMQFTAFLATKNLGELPTNFKALDRAAHIQRARFLTPPMPFPKKSALSQAPHLAHGSSAVQAGFSLTNNQINTSLGYRFAIHDILDADPGFLKNSSVEALSIKLAIHNRNLWIEDLTLARIDNFQPFYRFDPKASWRILVSLRENLMTANPVDHYGVLEGAYGLTAETAGQFIYAMIAGYANLSGNPVTPNFEIGPEIGTILHRGRIKGSLSLAGGQSFFTQSPRTFIKTKFGLGLSLQRDLALIVEGEWSKLEDIQQEGSRYRLGVRHYF